MGHLVRNRQYRQRQQKRTIFGQEIVGPTDNKFGDKVAEFLKFLFALSLDAVTGVCISATDNMIFKVLAKVVLGTKEIRVRKVEERKIFGEIILWIYISQTTDTRCRSTQPVLECQ